MDFCLRNGGGEQPGALLGGMVASGSPGSTTLVNSIEENLQTPRAPRQRHPFIITPYLQGALLTPALASLS